MAREGPAGAFKYEVIAKDGEDLLYVYLPKDVASRQGTHTLLLCRWWCSSAQKRPVAAKGVVLNDTRSAALLCCSAFPTYDEHSQKSGQLIIYFDTPEGQHVGSAEVSGKPRVCIQMFSSRADRLRQRHDGARHFQGVPHLAARLSHTCCWCWHAGFVLPDPVQAKFNRKQGRYTFK